MVSDHEPKIGETIEFTILAINSSSTLIPDVMVIPAVYEFCLPEKLDFKTFRFYDTTQRISIR